MASPRGSTSSSSTHLLLTAAQEEARERQRDGPQVRLVLHAVQGGGQVGQGGLRHSGGEWVRVHGGRERLELVVGADHLGRHGCRRADLGHGRRELLQVRELAAQRLDLLRLRLPLRRLRLSQLLQLRLEPLRVLTRLLLGRNIGLNGARRPIVSRAPWENHYVGREYRRDGATVSCGTMRRYHGRRGQQGTQS